MHSTQHLVVRDDQLDKHFDNLGIIRLGVKTGMAAALQQPPPAPRPTSVHDFIVPCQAIWAKTAQPELFNPSHCHPVFFTAKLRRPPFNVLSGAQLSPVAYGYVYQDAPGGSKKSAGPRL